MSAKTDHWSDLKVRVAILDYLDAQGSLRTASEIVQRLKIKAQRVHDSLGVLTTTREVHEVRSISCHGRPCVMFGTSAPVDATGREVES